MFYLFLYLNMKDKFFFFSNSSWLCKDRHQNEKQDKYKDEFKIMDFFEVLSFF